MSELIEARQVQQNQQGVENNTPTVLVPGSDNTTPWWYAGVSPEVARREMDASRQNTFNPPSEKNITKNMWLSSFMVGLAAALASGNAAGGIVAGMWAAIAVHDGGYALRQRGEHTDELLAQGYSYPAILKWYETGDNKDLEAEQREMRADTRDAANRKERRDEFAAREGREGRQFEQSNALAWAQFGETNRHNAAMEDNAGKALGAQLRADDRNAIRETQKLFEPAKTRQSNLDMAHITIETLREAVERGDKAAAAAAYNEARSELARAFAGGGATLTAEQLKEFSGLPSWIDDRTNTTGLAVNGMPTKLAVDVLSNMATIGRDTEMKTIRKQGVEVFNNFKSQGQSDEDAQRRTAIATQGTGIGDVDWKEEASKAASGDNSGSPTQTVVDDVMAKYGHGKK